MEPDRKVTTSNRPQKVLVVDDEYFNRDMLKERLTRSGFEVAEAEDGQEALKLINEGGIDLVLLDTMMPGMSGIELLKMVRAVHNLSELPIIMATAVNDSESIAGALKLGANDYVSKPIDYKVMLARIGAQLNRRAAEQDLREREERYALASRGTDDGIWDWDLVTNTVFYSGRWKEAAGGREAIGDSPEEWLSRVHRDDREGLMRDLEAHWAMAGGSRWKGDYRLLHKDGTYHWMHGRGHARRDETGRAIRMTGTQTDITDQKVYDPLTGLANRVRFFERANQALGAAKAGVGKRFAVYFLDLDRFKLVNDTMGHLAGDQLLVGIARRLRTLVDGGETRDVTIARFGGDEFAILLNDIGDEAEVKAFSEEVLRALEKPFDVRDRKIFCNVSIGATVASGVYGSVEDILRDADTAMYGAKACGGSRCVVFDESMRRRVEARLALESGLRTAMEREELEVYYQPKVRLDDGGLAGFEALVRWNHPSMGLIAPADFVPIAEETGQIVAIGEWVLREACRQMAEWHRRFPEQERYAVSVNLSVRQFRQPELVNHVARILEETKLEAQYLQLEITESVVMEDPDTTIATSKALKELGVGIKLDDFGTGYSSLSYLCRMPIDTLKIDRSFVGRMQESKADFEVVRTVLALAQSLEMDVVAEGLEQQEQILELRSLGCQFGQGYYFGRPTTAAETGALLESLAGSGASSE